MNKAKQNSESTSVKTEVKLDDSITKFFQILSKVARIRITLRFILLTFCFLGASWLLLGISDRIWATNIFVRSIIFFSGLFPAIWAMFNLFSFAFYYTRQLPWLAKSVRKAYRAKGERLLGIIEISEEEKFSNQSFSTQIFEAAQQKMSQEINSLKINNIFPWKKIRIPSVFSCVIFFIILLAFFYYPGLSKNTFKRWSFPFAPVERLTLTDILNDTSESFTILKNEFNTIKFSLSSTSRRKPENAKLILSNNSKSYLISSLESGVYKFNIPPQKRNLSAKLTVGDYSNTFSLQTVNRPRLETLSSLVSFPEYLSINSQIFDSLNNQIEIPENSEVTLLCKANRRINKFILSDSKTQLVMNPASAEFSINLQKIKKDKLHSLQMVDHLGFSQREPLSVLVKTKKDLPPVVTLNPVIDTSPVLLFETRRISFLNKDDFGIYSVSLSCNILRNQKKIQDIELISENFPNNGIKNFDLSFPFDPSLLSLEDGDEIIFTASAIDHFPGREFTQSKPLKLKIIGQEKHAEMIRAQMDSVISETAEIARNQEALQYQTLSTEAKLRESTEPMLNTKETSVIKDLKNDQNDLAKRLLANAKDGSEIINEAAKNPIFDSQTLSEFASSLSTLKKISSGPMLESEKNLNFAASSNKSKAGQSIMLSAQSQQQALEELRKVLAKFSQQLDRLEARTLAQRLIKLEKIENKLSNRLVSNMPSSIGMTTPQLDTLNISSFYEMEKVQLQVSEDADEVKNEISRYHERTQKGEYGKVSQLMKEANLKKGLANVAMNIRSNISFQALDSLNYWESSFKNWAKILQQESPGGDSPGGKGEGKDRTADILSLLKIRKIQSDILLKTKTLDQNGFRGNKKEWSLSLKDQQDTLMIDITDTQISMAEEAFNPLFDDAHTAMSESSKQLSKQIFDYDTQASQRESKDILSDIINLFIEGQGQGQESSDNENLTVMEFLMMQIGNDKSGSEKGNSPTPGNTGGGSTQGGSTNKVNQSLQGSNLSPTKSNPESKSGSNVSPSIAPEFKEAMEKYFKAIED